MKRILVIIIIIVFALTAAYLISGISEKIQGQNQLAERIKKLPEFSLPALNRACFSSSEIKEGPLLIIWFHPDCEHCQYEISELFSSQIFDTGTTVMLVSDAARDSVISFLNKFTLPDTDKLITLIDTAFVFTDIFGRAVIPSGYLYDKELKLIDIFPGEYKIEAILNRFSQNE
jgi:hypothetical protein